MKPIHPINEQNCREHYGKPVLVILKDGGEVTGILTDFGKGKLILNGEGRASLGSSDKSVNKRSSKKKKGNANVAAYPIAPFYPQVYGGGAGVLALDVVLIALLFAL
jgi:hypothetical protein